MNSLESRVEALERAVYEIRLARHCMEYPPGHAEHEDRKPKPPPSYAVRANHRIPGLATTGIQTPNQKPCDNPRP